MYKNQASTISRWFEEHSAVFSEFCGACKKAMAILEAFFLLEIVWQDKWPQRLPYYCGGKRFYAI